MIEIKISEEALQDLNHGYWFYEVQQAGIGDYFASCLRADIERLKFSAGTHRLVYKDYYHVVSRTFPFGIYYTMTENVTTIWAIVDLRQDPELIENILQSRD